MALQFVLSTLIVIKSQHLPKNLNISQYTYVIQDNVY